MIALVVGGCFHPNSKHETASTEGHLTPMDLPIGFTRIDVKRNDQLNHAPFNLSSDGYRPGSDESYFSDRFNDEIGSTKERFSTYFSQFGEFGSLDRSTKGLPSHWWIDDDFHGVSRVLMVDLLNPALTRIEVLKGAQRELNALEHDWMLLLAHNNDYNDVGEYVGLPGEYWIWITKESVEIYSELDKDLETFYSSLDRP
ncbi:hypothetical protein SH528x_002126 [Novipirellula sp. SH528]|uniref:hypothetical protein n=1 Tax=Novipirellula sp. SH528 TaxID=3454466 RepID=UPI003F9FF9B7